MKKSDLIKPLILGALAGFGTFTLALVMNFLTPKGPPTPESKRAPLLLIATSAEIIASQEPIVAKHGKSWLIEFAPAKK